MIWGSFIKTSNAIICSETYSLVHVKKLMSSFFSPGGNVSTYDPFVCGALNFIRRLH